MSRGLSVDGRVEGQDNLLDPFCRHPIDEPGNAEFVWAHRVESRKRAAEDVIASPEDARTLHRPEVGDVADHTDLSRGALLACADTADVVGGDVAAVEAFACGRRDRGHGFGQRRHELAALAYEMQHRAPGRARPEPRQLRHHLDERLDLDWRLAHGPRTAASCRRESRIPG